MNKFKSFTYFPGLRAAGPMVSMFARRLGSIKKEAFGYKYKLDNNLLEIN